MKFLSAARLASLGLAVMLGVTACKLDGVNQFTLNAVTTRLRTESRAPGAALAWVTSDRIVTAVDGVRRADRPERLPPSGRFHLGSNAKAMLATVIAMAVEDGLLRWDMPIVEVLPEVKDSIAAQPAFAKVQLQDLLAHRSGLMALTELQDIYAVPQFSGSPVEQRVQFSVWALSQEPAEEYGKTLYSNADYAIAAAMLERATGSSWDVLLQGYLFGPLGIKARFNWPAAGGRAQPWGHQIQAGVAVPSDPDAPESAFPEFLKPAAHVSMSARDYGRFIQLHLRALRGRPDLLSAESFAQLHRARGDFALGWAFGDLNGIPSETHHGTAGTFEAMVVMQPERDRAVILLINAFDDLGTTTTALVTAAAAVMRLDDEDALR